MQITAIGANPQRNSQLRQNFEGKRDNIDAFINLDDSVLQMAAYEETAKSVNDKKHKKLDNLLINLVPVAAGITTAAFTPKLLSKTGRYEKLAGFLTTTAGWFASFGIIDLVFKGKQKLDEKFDKLREFSQKNPLVSFIATAGASFGVLAGANKLLGKFSDKYITKVIDKHDAKISNAILKTADKLDKNRVLNWASKGISKLAQKTPSALKNFGKSLVKYAPFLVAFGAICHSINHTNVKNREFNKHYDYYKNLQDELSKKRIQELTLENDLLLQKPENVEDLALLKDNVDL